MIKVVRGVENEVDDQSLYRRQYGDTNEQRRGNMAVMGKGTRRDKFLTVHGRKRVI